MPDSGLFGPYALNSATIDAVVRGTSPGAYALGSANAGGGLSISYVGRSDSDLHSRLKQHVGSYSSFKYGFTPSAHAAFLVECRLFHDFGAYSLDNKIHPARPAGSNWTCPHCKALG